MEEGADAATDRIICDNGRVRRTIVIVPDPATAVDVAVEVADKGIELDDGFGTTWAAKIFEAIDGRAPIGFVTFGFDSLESVAEFKQWYESQTM